MRVAFCPETVFPATVVLDLMGFVLPGMTQSVTLSIGGRTEKTVVFGAATASSLVPIAVQSTDLSQDLRAEITFDISNPASPASFGMSDDGRDLGVAVKSVGLV
jgi:hypothetical protein